MASFVLDSSALLALLNDEPGTETVERALTDAMISTVNLAEVVGKLVERGMPEEEVRAIVDTLGLDMKPFDVESAYLTGALRASTKERGLSLGDRACIALALKTKATALTADRIWLDAGSGARIELVR